MAGVVGGATERVLGVSGNFVVESVSRVCIHEEEEEEVDGTRTRAMAFAEHG